MSLYQNATPTGRAVRVFAPERALLFLLRWLGLWNPREEGFSTSNPCCRVGSSGLSRVVVASGQFGLLRWSVVLSGQIRELACPLSLPSRDHFPRSSGVRTPTGDDCENSGWCGTRRDADLALSLQARGVRCRCSHVAAWLIFQRASAGPFWVGIGR
jgi:hypothetical protein